ncbi:recombinase family protein, partial [Cribrihabitans sp. XS_ASV171]
EVTAERIRDKIAASKKKGLWMGGNLPLGYDRHSDPNTRILVINPDEADRVRRLFTLCADLGCLRRVTEAAAREGLRSKRQLRANGAVSGDLPLSRGQIYYLLRNPVYLGRIRHKEKVWPGQHPAIIGEALWDDVQEKLQAAAARSRQRDTKDGAANSIRNTAWLTAKLRDETGDRLTPTHTTRNGRRLRYYVSNRLISGGSDPSGWRLPGPALEQAARDITLHHLEAAAEQHRVLERPDATSGSAVAGSMQAFVEELRGDANTLIGELIEAGTVSPGRIELDLDPGVLAEAVGVTTSDLAPSILRISAPFDLRRRGVEAKIIVGARARPPDPHLRTMLIRAHGWARELKTGTQLTDIARRENVPGSFIRNRAQLAFLSPKIQAAILDGTQPPELSLKRLVSVTLPLDWTDQERMFGF